jgi:DNA-binding NarL/FixJ family response regulator
MNTSESPLKLINLLIVDDHQMIRDGIKIMLKSHETIFRFNITEADSGENAILKMQTKIFDVVIVDCELPGIKGNQTIAQVKEKNPQAKFLALSNYDELTYVQEMINAGAMGYILKNVEVQQLIQAIKSVLENKPYYSSEVAVKLMQSGHNGTATNGIIKAGLTKREFEILTMIAQEKTNEEIAEMLFISKRTVDTHRQNLMHKLRAKNTAGLIKAAYQLKIV